MIEAYLPDHAYAFFPLLCRAAPVLHMPLFLTWQHADRSPALSRETFERSAWSRWPGYTNRSVAERLERCPPPPHPPQTM